MKMTLRHGATRRATKNAPVGQVRSSSIVTGDWPDPVTSRISSVEIWRMGLDDRANQFPGRGAS